MMKRLFTALAAFLLLGYGLGAQYRTTLQDLDDSETVRALKQHVAALSAAELEGRRAGSEGEKMAAQYLEDWLREYGIDILSSGNEFGVAVGADTVHSRNVTGFLQGWDKSLNKHYIVIGARMDNLGMDTLMVNGEPTRRIYYGANGNASGMAMLLELAQKLSYARTLLRRSILFVGFGASQETFAGSWYFLHRAFADDAANIDAMVNLDMLGTAGRGFYAFTSSNEDLNTIASALKGELAAYGDYVAAAKPEIEEARTALIKADEEVEKADADRQAKQAAYNNYVTSQASISYQAQNERMASNALKVAEENLRKAQMDFSEKNFTVEELKAKIELDTYNLYLADSTAAKRQREYNVAAEKVTTEIVTAKNDAIAAVTTQEGVIATAQANFDAAVEAFRAAMVVYTATPNATTLADLQTKEQEMNTAKQTMQTEEAKMEGETGLIAKMNAAIDAFNTVNGPAEDALKAWDSAKEIANDARAKLGNKSQPASSAVNATTWQKYNQAVIDFNTAKTDLGEETDPKSYTGSAWAKYNQAKDDLEVAHKANPDDSEEYIKLYDEWQEAERVYNERVAERATKGQELSTAYYKYPEYCWQTSSGYGYEKEVDSALESYIYWGGVNVVTSTTYKNMDSWQTYESYFSIYVPSLHKPCIAWYEAKLKDLKAQYDENVAAQEKTVTDLEKEIAKIKEALAGYKAMETDYLAYGEELVNAKKAYYEALKDETDAKNVQSEAQAAYNALNALLTAKVYVDENGNQKTTEQLETLITQKKKDIIAAYDQLEELYNQYMMLGRKDAAGKYEVEYIAQLRIDIEKLEAELAVLEAQIESYAAELEILLEELGGEPDVE